MSKTHILYQFPECPFCQRVLMKMQDLGIEIPVKDTRRDSEAREELIQLTGRTQVPCLVIDGKPMLESADICDYLEREFS